MGALGMRLDVLLARQGGNSCRPSEACLCDATMGDHRLYYEMVAPAWLSCAASVALRLAAMGCHFDHVESTVSVPLIADDLLQRPGRQFWAKRGNHCTAA